MKTELRLQTARLELVPFSVAFVDALGDRVVAAHVIGASVPEGWPDAELAQLLAVYAPWIAEDPSRVGYGPWVVISRSEDAVVGSAGFMGTPKEDRAIELGFGTISTSATAATPPRPRERWSTGASLSRRSRRSSPSASRATPRRCACSRRSG